MRVAVTGAHGQLGAAIVAEFTGAYEVTAFGRADLDIADATAVTAAMARVAPDVIINCAAMNDVDGAEERPIEALDANAFGVRALARAAGETGAVLVHYSTDFVFDGTATEPYRETDPPNPRSTYAQTKLLGEWFAREVPSAYVVRVESLFGSVPSTRPPKGSVAGIVRGILTGVEVPVFEDRTVSPTYVIDAARATREIVERRIEPGLYHCVNAGHCTWLAFAKELARQLGLEARLRPVRLADMPLRAERPRFCALSCDKLAAAGVPMPSREDAVSRYLSQLRRPADRTGHGPSGRTA